MTTSSTETGEKPTGRWGKRVATLLVCWALVWTLTAWLQMHPQPLGLLAAVGTVFAIGWWSADRWSDWDTTEWQGEPVGRRLRASSDSRISYLRRQIDNAATDDGRPNASAAGLQGTLRDLSLDRLRLRAEERGSAELPDDERLLAGADPQLARYLCAQPAPPVSRQTVNDIINRIEAL